MKLRKRLDTCVTLVRRDGTKCVYEKVKHVMYQENRVILIIGEHDKDRQYIWYPSHQVDHVIIQEIVG